MTALVRARVAPFERWTYKQFPLAVGFKAYKGGFAVWDLTLGKVKPAAPGLNARHIGKFAEDVDATSVEKLVNVNLGVEIEVDYIPNDTVAPVTLAMRGQVCYFLDDNTVTAASAGNPIAGIVWDVDSARGGVAVQKAAGSGTSLSGLGFATATAPAYVANDSIIVAGTPSGSIFDVPTTGAASTITLPAATRDGTTYQFVADGTKNAHTVQYRDAAGSVNLTTALTASKRHLVIATSLNGKWSANAYVSP